MNGDVQMKVTEHQQRKVDVHPQQQQQLSNKSRAASQSSAAAAVAADVGNVVLESVHKDTLEDHQRNVVVADMNKHDADVNKHDADDRVKVPRRDPMKQDVPPPRVSNNSVPSRAARDAKHVDSAL